MRFVGNPLLLIHLCNQIHDHIYANGGDEAECCHDNVEKDIGAVQAPIVHESRPNVQVHAETYGQDNRVEKPRVRKGYVYGQVPSCQLQRTPVMVNLIWMERINHEQEALESVEAISHVASFVGTGAQSKHDDVENRE